MKYCAKFNMYQVCENIRSLLFVLFHIWGKVFKNGPSKICGRQPLKHLKGYGMPKAEHTHSIVLKAVFHKFYLVHS